MMRPCRFIKPSLTPLFLTMGLVLAQTAPAAGKIPRVCAEEAESCREGCTLEFGTSTKKRKKFVSCIKRCKKETTACKARFAERRTRTKVEESEKKKPLHEPADEKPSTGLIRDVEPQPTTPSPPPEEKKLNERPIDEWDPDGP